MINKIIYFLFLLIDSDEIETTTTIHSLYYDDGLVSDNVTNIDVDHGSINEFQLIESNENKSTCVIIQRLISEEEEKPLLKSISTNNCSQLRHVLCETNTIIIQNFQYACFIKPKILDLPALISNQLTHELCLSVCQQLQTKLAILHINKCYCLNGANPYVLNITTDFQKYRQKDCGNACSGWIFLR